MSDKRKDKLNVLIIHNFYKLTGGEDTVFNNEVELLKSNGYRVITYTRSNKEIDNFSLFEKALLPFKYLFDFKIYRAIKKIIKDNNIDIIHVHNTLSIIGSAPYIAALNCKIPIVQTIHNFRFVCPNGLLCRDGKVCVKCIRNGLFNAVRNKCYHDSYLQTLVIVLGLKLQRVTGLYKKLNLICLTEFNKNILLNIASIDIDKLFVKPNSCPKFKGDIIPYNQRENYYCFVGRLDEYKGVRQLLEALKRVPDVKLLICGDGPLYEWCNETVNKFCLNCRLLGKVDHDTVLNLISRSRGLIVPSIVYEGLPMTIIEAFSTGTPVIGRKIGNIEATIVENKLGRLFVTDRDFVRILKNIDSYSSQYIVDYYLNNFSNEVNLSTLSYIYKSCISKV